MTTPALTSPAPSVEATPPVAAPARTLAIVSLVLGAASIVTGFNPVMGVTGLVVGILALRQEPAGRSLAIAGIATSAVSVGGILLGIGAFVAAIPFFAFAGAWGW